MKKLPVAMKIVFNIIFFVLYSILAMNFINFLYDSVLHLFGKVVPVSGDLIHLKIAGAVLIFTIILTIVFRKYFYFSLNEQEIEKSTKKVSKTKEIKKEDKEIIEENDEGIRIYIDKEMK